VLTLLQETDAEAIQPELLNNIAALYHISADSLSGDMDLTAEKKNELRQVALDSAEELYQQSMILLTSESYVASQDGWKVNALQTTIRFNIARLYEAKGEAVKAEGLYHEILKSHPAHVDSTYT
jgi:hypothetical protein